MLIKDPLGCHFPNFSNRGSIDFVAADRTNIEITIKQTASDLKNMQEYLRRLYCWFLLGPVITLEWLRRKKKLFCISGDQQARGELEETAVESRLNSAANYEDVREQTGGETQPLLPVLSDPFANGHRRPRAIRHVLTYLGKLFGKVAVNNVILIVVALPVGISSGGWSFFKFDQNGIQQRTFWDDLIPCYYNYSYPVNLLTLFNCFLPLWWSPLQIFCFFLYSRFTCKTTWTVPTNFSKLIRSDWFSSNMYLLILGVVVPYCSLVSRFEMSSTFMFAYYATYNMVCTICNVLFIIILKQTQICHKVCLLHQCMYDLCLH